MTFQEYLSYADACAEACDWAKDKSWEEVYATCHRGDWLCWLYARTNPSDIRVLTLVKGLQVNEIRHLMSDNRSLAAVDAAIAYGRGQINEKQLLAAADAAYAAYAAYASAAADAASAAAAAYAASAAAAYAASASADAAYVAADADDVYVKSLRRSADIFRENIPYEKINRPWETM